MLNGDAARDRAAKRHPIEKIGTVEDMAAAAEFLLGPESSWITGQIIAIDGGLSSLRLF